MSEQTRADHPIYSLLPTEIEGFDSLAELALNMRSSWNHATDGIWRQLDPNLWKMTHNPWVVLQTVSRDRIEALMADPSFRKNVDDLLETRRMAIETPAWFQLHHPGTALAALKPGDPMDTTTTLGPLSTESALVQLLDQVERAVAHGATLVMGGKRIDRPGSFMQPTILANISATNPAYREEFFGPVALFFRVRNEDEAVALANDSDFGLGGSVFTGDVTRGKRVAGRVDTGMMFVNHPTWTTPDLPFGGIKNSGYGRELSSSGIQEFVNKKLVRVDSIDAAA